MANKMPDLLPVENKRHKVCLVKQNSTYDLYTRAGPTLEEILASSNWRSGPLGLWEAFDCAFRIVWENPEAECQIGKRQWGKYVQGWKVWPDNSRAEHANLINWGEYDIIIAIDVAVPSRIVRRFPR